MTNRALEAEKRAKLEIRITWLSTLSRNLDQLIMDDDEEIKHKATQFKADVEKWINNNLRGLNKLKGDQH